MVDQEYQKLPGKGMRSSGLLSVSRSMCTMYLGLDHLLQVDTIGGYSEEYKRFYFRDIQAITLRKTQTAAIALSSTGVFGLLFGLIARASSNEVVSYIFYTLAACLILIFLFLAVLFLLRGGSCICFVKTAVQTEQMPSLKRIRVAQKVLARIQPLIEQTQGALAGDELKAKVEATLQPPPPPVINSPYQARSVVVPPTAPAPPRHYPGTIHAVLFVLLLVAGLLSLLHVFFHPTWFVAVETVFSVALLFVVIVALVKQSGTDLSLSVRRTTQVALGYLCVNAMFGYIVGTVMAASNPETAGNQWAIIKVFSEFEPMEQMWLLIELIVSALVSVSLGVLGLLFLVRSRSTALSGQVPPPPPVDQLPS